MPPLIHRRALPPDPAAMERAFAAHGWSNAWRNGVSGFHHVHSTAHEVRAIAAVPAPVPGSDPVLGRDGGLRRLWVRTGGPGLNANCTP